MKKIKIYLEGPSSSGTFKIVRMDNATEIQYKNTVLTIGTEIGAGPFSDELARDRRFEVTARLARGF